MTTGKIRVSPLQLRRWLWPTSLLGLLLRMAVPGDVLLTESYWLVPLVTGAHLLAVYLLSRWALRKGLYLRAGFAVSQGMFIFFWLAQLELDYGQVKPVLVWLLEVFFRLEINMGYSWTWARHAPLVNAWNAGALVPLLLSYLALAASVYVLGRIRTHRPH